MDTVSEVSETAQAEFVHMVMDRLHAVEDSLQKREAELADLEAVHQKSMNAVGSYIMRYTNRFVPDVTADMITKAWVEAKPWFYQSVDESVIGMRSDYQVDPVLRVNRFEIALRMGWIDVAGRVMDAHPFLADTITLLGDGDVWTAERFARHPSPDVPEETRAALGDLVRSRRKLSKSF